MIKYRLSFGQIEKRNVTRETDKSIWYDEISLYNNKTRNVMCRKDCVGTEWFNTFEEAKNQHVKNKTRSLCELKQRVDIAISQLETAKQLTEKTEK